VIGCTDGEIMKTFHEIKNRYPYQFEGKNIGLSVAKGWLPEFAALCQRVDDLLGQNKPCLSG